ncbi:MAG TPA: DUF4350 domain-containing protein [Bacteroidota bacterium]|nr:DUF4350 domain-containing protein [Bacteroidota bacterium]
MRHSLLRTIIALFLFSVAAQRLYPQVNPIGPGGGIVNVVRGDANDSVVLAGTKNDGIYRSLDGGATWTQALSVFPVNDIVFHPTTPLTAYAATQAGLYVSYDAGASWSLTPLTTPVSTIAIDVALPLLMFAGDARPTLQGAAGVFKSTDGGLTWAASSTGLTVSRTITALIIDPAGSLSGMTVYAGTDAAGVYSTSDGGSTWSALATNAGLAGSGLRIHSLSLIQGLGLRAGTSSGEYFCPGGVQWIPFTGTSIADSVVQCSLTVGDSAATDTFYVGTKGNEEFFPTRPDNGGVYRRSNLGLGWTLIFKATIDINSIFIPASHPKKIYLGTSDGVYESSDDGSSWARQNSGMMNSIARTVAVQNSASGYLFAGVYGGGILKSTNGGGTWIPSNNGIDNPYVRGVIADPKNSAVLYAGNVYGLYKSVDTGSTWQKIQTQNIPHDSLSPFNNNLEDGTLRISPVNSQNLFISALTGEFMVSTDGGGTWYAVAPPQQIPTSVVGNIEFDPVSASTMYFSANGVWRSTDLGKTWNSISGNLPLNATVNGTTAPLIGFHPRIDPVNTSEIFLSTLTGGAIYNEYRTTNGGANWTQLNAAGIDVAFDPVHPSTLYCTAVNGVLRSPDDGLTWTKIGGGPSTQYYSIGQSTANDTTMFVGSNRGITAVDTRNALGISQVSFDFGTVPIGSVSGQNITFSDNGSQSVTITVASLTVPLAGPSAYIVPPGATPLVVKPGSSGTLTIQFIPKLTGPSQATLTFATTDPGYPTVGVTLKGTGVPVTAVNRSVLLDTTHGVSSSLATGSITQFLSEFIQALQRSGITVSSQTAFDPLASSFDAVMIAAPKTTFSLVEINKLHQYVSNGGFVVMLGDSGNSDANNCLNGILSNFQWVQDAPNTPTGLAMNSDAVTDGVRNYSNNPAAPLLSNFTDTTHPFVKGVHTIIPFGCASIALSAQASPFLRGNLTTVATTSDSLQKKTAQPVVMAMSQVGKGTILLIGDVDIWSNVRGKDTLSPLPTGILAGDNLQFALNVFGFTGSYSVKIPSPTLSDQYQIISIPFDLLDFNISDVLKDLGAADKTKWRLYGRWDGSEYQEYPSPDFLTFKRGEGYWLITKGSQSLSLGSANVSTAQGFFPIQLDSGYNLIGNPFPYPVSWANSLHSTPDSVESWLWGFDGAGFQQVTDIMQPFAGYFLKSLRNGVTVYINPDEVSSASLAKKAEVQRQFAQGEWQVQISAANGTGADNDNVAGVLRSASDEWDAEDFSEPPPAPTDYVTLSFNHPNWKTNPGRYAGDYRPIHPEGNYWDFDIASSNSKASVSVQFVKSGNMPAQFEMYLVDMTTERAYDISSALSYNFAYEKNESDRLFRLIVGTKEYIGSNTNGIPLVPVGYSLDQNYPNPFNPTTTIGYSLAHSGYVTLEIFNVLGQKVKTLFTGDQKIGNYSVVWDGTGDNGAGAASGIYFYRIKTEAFSFTKKMVFLK